MGYKYFKLNLTNNINTERIPIKRFTPHLLKLR